MPTLYLRCQDPLVFEQGFSSIRSELDIPSEFPPAVLAAMDRPWVDPFLERVDLSTLPFISIDPEGSRDLDQAFYAERQVDGYLVRYAIADVAAFVQAGDVVDHETRQRGVTLYAPDHRTPLHPPEMSEGRASLLEGAVRPAIVWNLRLDAQGNITETIAVRCLVRNTEMLSYAEGQRRLDEGVAGPVLDLVREIGRLRQVLEQERDAVSLNLPSQELEKTNGSYELAYDTVLDIEGWNAQISLMTGMAAAQLMINGQIGLLRTLPIPDERTLEGLRRHSRALSVPFTEDMSYAAWVRTLDPSIRRHVALLSQAGQGLRGAGYLAFQGPVPDGATHSAIAAHYTHVTAPLRRLVDRFTLEICVALSAQTPVPGWVTDAFGQLPDLMKGAKRRSNTYSRALVDFAETLVLTPRVGETFEAVVTGLSNRGVTLQIMDPAIITRVSAEGLNLGQRVSVKLTEVNSAERTLGFELDRP